MDDLIPIGRVARAAQVSQKALRLYDEEGLLRPARVDESSGYRLYLPEQIHDARLIHFLRGAGMPLAEIRAFLADRSEERLDEYDERLETELAARRKALGIARRILAAKSHFEVDEKDVAAVRYVGRRSSVAAGDEGRFIRDAIRELTEASRPAGPPFAIYHEIPKDDRPGDVEVGLPTDAGELELAPATVVFTVLRGDQARYPKIIAGYDAIWDWAHARKREFAGPPRELYWDLDDSATLELQWPIA
jgi:DNA-binding transcriptional MerR regulator